MLNQLKISEKKGQNDKEQRCMQLQQVFNLDSRENEDNINHFEHKKTTT